MTDTGTAVGYTLDNAWEQARHRLGLLHSIFDRTTTRWLDDVGVGRGWRCLEVGGGGGSIARWLCDRVGDSGRVLVTDIDTRFVDELSHPALQVMRNDLTADALPAGEFDLVHARMVLEHLPGRAGLVRKLAAAVAPGGWLLLEDVDAFGALAFAGPEVAQVLAGCEAALAAAGGDYRWGRQLPAAVADLGFEQVQAEGFVPIGRGGSDLAEGLRLTLIQSRPLVLATGVPEETFDAAAAVLADPAQWAATALIGVRGRRPAR